jgi:integrase
MARWHVRKRQLKRPRSDERRSVWDAWVPTPTGPDGKRRPAVKKGFGTEREARVWISEQLALASRGVPGSPGQFGQLLEAWLVSKHGLKPTARASYRRHIDRHLSSVADRDAAKLTSADLLVAYAELLDKGLSGTTVRPVHTTAHGCLSWAVRHDKLIRNVAAMITSEDLPPKNHVEMTAWTGQEVAKILDAANGDLRSLFSVMVRTGLRRGEALALRWEDVNTETATLRVERSLVPRPGGGLDVLRPKTRQSRRTVDAPPSVLETLAELQHPQKAQRLVSGQRPGEFGDLVFTRLDGVTPLSPGTVSREFRNAVRRAGVRPGRLHDLRHSFASLALAAGVPVIIVSRALGHSQPSTTLNVYAHLLPGTSGQAMAAVDAALALPSL